VTPAERTAAIERLLAGLKDRYVFPDKAQKAQTALRGRMKRGEYDKIEMGHALAKALTGHLNDVLKDAHFHVA
jgi:predicted esterase